jgi:hypothetical protein
MLAYSSTRRISKIEVPEFPTELALKQPQLVAAEILKDPVVGPLVISDLKRSLAFLGLQESETLAGAIATSLSAKKPRIDIARHIVAPHRETFYSAFQGRSLRLAEAIAPEISSALAFSNDNKRLFDWGTGDTQVAAAVNNLFQDLTVQGGDVIIYHGGQPLVPFFEIKRNKVPSLPSHQQKIVTANYVLHHEARTDQVFNEFDRLLSRTGHAIVTELIPCGSNEQDIMHDRKRLWFSDFMYCVVWHKGDKIPMPGNYRTVADWSEQASESGFKLVSARPINGTPLIYCNPVAGRQVMVFEKESI